MAGPSDRAPGPPLIPPIPRHKTSSIASSQSPPTSSTPLYTRFRMSGSPPRLTSVQQAHYGLAMKSDTMTTSLVNVNGLLPPPKQIRFVNNQGQPPSKRRRINAACLTCRKRKTRCAGEKPNCSTCSKNGHVCLGYNDFSERKRDDKGRSWVKGEADETTEAGEDGEDYLYDDEAELDDKRAWKARERAKSNALSSVETSSRCDSESSAGASLQQQSVMTLERGGDEWDTDPRHSANQPARRATYPTSGQLGTKFSEGSRASSNRSPLQHRGVSHRVPYFRYFGPTAIVPGYKQVVVSVRHRRKSRGGSFSATSPATLNSGIPRSHAAPGESVLESPEDVPCYDPNDSSPVHPVILILVKTFFLQLGCNYPFLKEEKFLRAVEEKRVEPILVDAVCALAARFSDHPIFAAEAERKVARSDFGHVFAQRAKAATVDTFPCPSVGAVQAFLLMAYEGFGADQDSALWMYLGLAIRMAVDVGLPRVEGVKYQGEKDPWYTRNWGRKPDEADADAKQSSDHYNLSPEEQQEVEQERIDTFWAVFILDRVISSGTGRPVTFRDDDFELMLPEPTVDPATGWPAPFPTFIRIVHLFGRASDVLNKIKQPDDLTPERLRRLEQMEHDLTKIYQKQDPRLNFTIPNFQEYVRAGQGTTFILLHIWFHALIIILHQPTLLFGSTGQIHKLLPNSRELSMSSAKTIADILAFAELIDPKSYIGNPFTSQPMYIAACAFLMESLSSLSQPPSRETTPVPDSKPQVQRFRAINAPPSQNTGASNSKSTRHSLLTTAANQNYQRCFKSLQQLHTYWGGVKYILTALDFRSAGVWDCETFTAEEYEATKMLRRQQLQSLRVENPASPSVPPIAISLTGTTNSPNSNLTLMYQNSLATLQPQHLQLQPRPPTPALPMSAPVSAPTPPGNMIYDPIRQSLPDPPPVYSPAYPQANVSAVRHSVHAGKHRPGPNNMNGDLRSPAKMGYGKYDDGSHESVEHGELKHHMMSGVHHQQHGNSSNSGMHSTVYSFASSSPQQSSGYESSIMHGESPDSNNITDSVTVGGGGHYSQSGGGHGEGGSGSGSGSSHNGGSGGERGGGNGGSGYQTDFVHSGLVSGSYSYMTPMTEMITYDSQDIDIGPLSMPSEMVAAPWLEYMSGDVLGLFDAGAGTSGGSGGMHHGGGDG